jgi:hypothetical protein
MNKDLVKIEKMLINLLMELNVPLVKKRKFSEIN